MYNTIFLYRNIYNFMLGDQIYLVQQLTNYYHSGIRPALPLEHFL
jgi:hypothetical protein